MNKFLGIVFLFLLLPTVSWAAGKEKKKQTQSGQTQYWTGNGGKGISLAILAPRGNGLAANQNYLPDLVQGEFVSTISGYSAISVLDRVNLDKIIAETIGSAYKDNVDIIRLGHVTHTAYIMTGTITKTASGYNLQAQIASAANGMIQASYSGNCTFAEMDNLTGVRRASLDLLQKMGVTLTAQAREELSGAGQINHVNAQTSLAMGIDAQRNGNTIETMARFYEAAAYDPSFAEAAVRANTMSASIRTGNDIARRDEWVKIFDDAQKFILANPPVIAQVIHDPAPRQGKPDYNQRTVDFEFTIDVKGVPYPPAYIKMITDLNDGLAATKQNKDWNLEPLSLSKILSQYAQSAQIDYTAELVNSAGKVIARTSEGIEEFGDWGAYDYGLGQVGFEDAGTAPNLQMINPSHDDTPLYPLAVSFTARANDITDQMTIGLYVTAKSQGVFQSGENGPDFSKYPIEVITREMNSTQSMAKGLPPMKTRKIFFYKKEDEWDGNKFVDVRLSSMTVEIPSTQDERKLLLSYRPSLADGHGVYMEGIPEYIDTTHYRFPVSVAYFSSFQRKNIITKIIDIKPGRKEPIPKGINNQGSEQIIGILIVPKGWFKRAKIRTGNRYYFNFTG